MDQVATIFLLTCQRFWHQLTILLYHWILQSHTEHHIHEQLLRSRKAVLLLKSKIREKQNKVELQRHLLSCHWQERSDSLWILNHIQQAKVHLEHWIDYLMSPAPDENSQRSRLSGPHFPPHKPTNQKNWQVVIKNTSLIQNSKLFCLLHQDKYALVFQNNHLTMKRSSLVSNSTL